MRLGGRARAAAEILAEIAARYRPAADALKDWGLAHRFAGSGDRAAIGNLVHDTLRKKASQAWRMGADSPPALVYASLISQWGLEPEQLAAEFNGDPHAPEPLAAEMLQHWTTADLAEAPDHVRADIPQWCGAHFQDSFGPQWIDEAAMLSERPPLDLRVNTLKATREKVLKQLERTGARATVHSPVGIRIAPPLRDRRSPNVQAEPAFQKGWFEIQDEGSQLTALLAGGTPGSQVLDYCAGGGGKSLALAAAMGNRGQIHAHDSDRHRLAPIHERLRRAGARNVQVHDPATGSIGALEGRMDCVLVDAPCTGSGTWRRRPDAKWRIDEKALAKRMAEQDQVLAGAARFVKPGGRLVYVTCSMFAAENAGRVRDFLNRHGEFAADPLEKSLSGLCDPAHLRIEDRFMVNFTPLRTGTDGFFLAAMKKKQ